MEISPDRPGNPWEHRQSQGGLTAFVEALKMFAATPRAAFHQTLTRGDYWSPLFFAIIAGCVASVIQQLWNLLFGASFLAMLPADVRGVLDLVAIGTGGLLFNLILTPAFILVGVFIWATILHLSLVIVGGLAHSEGGFEGSFRVVSYSQVAQLANIVPVVGGLIAVVWGIVLAVLGTQELHRTTQGKAIAAVLAPILLCCIATVVLVTVGIATFVASQN